MKSLDNSMKIKPRTYYKIYHNHPNSYTILYTGNKWIYLIAEKKYDNPLVKYDKKFKWYTINSYQEFLNRASNVFIEHPTIKELTKEEVFLELL